MDTHKKCNKCKVEKDFSEFSKANGRKGGLQPQCKECKRQYRADNKAAIAAYRKQYDQENREKVSHQQAEYKRNRRATDPTYLLIHNHRSRVNHALDGIGKEESSIELLGCTAEQFRQHIESQFVEGMGWNQRGLWHVDHYHPLAAFDLKIKKHQKYAFHWSNCSPLWAEDNLKKSDRHCPDELKEYLKSKLPKYEDVYTL